MEPLTEEELGMVKERFEFYKDRYSELTGLSSQPGLEWEYIKGGLFHNFLPLEIERSGFKKGKPVKKEPETKNEIVAYAREQDQLRIMRYFVQGHISAETFFIEEPDKMIKVRYADGIQLKTLDQLSILFTSNGRPLFSISYSEDRRNHTIVKEGYHYTGDKLTEVEELGYIHRSAAKIPIDRTATVEYGEKGVVSEIYVQDNNLASGAVRKTKVFPK